ncbi:hypothetical protein [Pseudomonas fragi]|uniref:hypothetical protein n=1 Tax=Pseudomonas fragi TaxID=296 RepID=UPI0014731A64|nr:hypothetical protein [Pseudomonas fragi]NNB36131.1 hypothetical protein [Pseudomonas fragi]
MIWKARSVILAPDSLRLHPEASCSGDHVDEHSLSVNVLNRDRCTPTHQCDGHPAGHVHGPGCAHEPVLHDDHVDYLVVGHLHNSHDGHHDDHCPVTIKS